MAKITFTHELEDELVDSLKKHWEDGGQILLGPPDWKCMNDLPPITIGHNSYEAPVELDVSTT